MPSDPEKKQALTRVKGHCPNCGPDIWADVECEFEDNWSDPESGIWGEDKHRILRCRGCERVYFQTSAVFSEDHPSSRPTITHWPPPERRKSPRWLIQLIGIDTVLYSVTQQTYSALNEDLSILNTIGARTIFDRSAEMLGVDANLTFPQKLDSLVQLGKIGADERNALNVLTEAGSAAAHRAWRPRLEQLETIIDVIEGFLHRSFFVHDAAKDLAQEIPARSKQLPKS
jgi:hypothetical protein